MSAKATGERLLDVIETRGEMGSLPANVTELTVHEIESILGDRYQLVPFLPPLRGRPFLFFSFIIEIGLRSCPYLFQQLAEEQTFITKREHEKEVYQPIVLISFRNRTLQKQD